MAQACDRGEVVLRAPDGRERGRLVIVPTYGPAPAIPPLLQLSPQEAAEWLEEPLQLLEGLSYEYELHSALREAHMRPGETLSPSALRGERESGRIEPGLHTGMLVLVLESTGGEEIAIGTVEVRSAKVGYRDQYRRMLGDIAEVCAGFLMDLRAPSRTRFAPDPGSDARTIAERFSFLKSLLDSSRFREAVHLVLQAPHRAVRSRHEEGDIRRSLRPDASLLRQIVSGANRQPVPPTHPLSGRLPSVPARITVATAGDTHDTAENRFLKHALRSFEEFLLQMEVRLRHSRRPADGRLRRDIGRSRSQLTAILSHSLFARVSDPAFLPLGSPVLHRKPGYREVFQSWLQFRLAAALSWEGGEDVYHAGKRDVAVLYEYWVFFQLLRLLTEKFTFDENPAETIIEATSDGFGLKLKSGKALTFFGTYEGRGRRLRVRFSYNRTYSRKPVPGVEGVSYPAAGSWTQRMRPDYTVSLWPAHVCEDDAESLELITHIHFDAKYRVESLTQLFGTDAEDELALDREGDAGLRAPRRVDLLKMHAYRDAIRRSVGAFVIYPGDQSRHWRGFHEILPGIGAFSLCPDARGTGAGDMSQFLDDVLAFVCDRAALYPQASYHLHRVQRDPPGVPVYVPLPEPADTEPLPIPIAEQPVLVLPADAQSLEAAASTRSLAVEVASFTGSLPDLLRAAYVLLLPDDGTPAIGMLPVLGPGPRILSGQDAAAEAIPVPSQSGAYVVFEVNRLPVYTEWAWNRMPQMEVLSPAAPTMMSLASALRLARPARAVPGADAPR